jgi:hypothetical protein
MTCLKVNTTISSACRDSVPGVTEFYFANYSDVTTLSYNVDETQITGITMSGSTLWYKISVNRYSSSVSDEGVIDVPNGIGGHKPIVTLKLQNITNDVIKLYNSLIQSTVMTIVKLTSGDYYLLGADNGLDAETAKLSAGTANTDFKGLECTLSGFETSAMVNVDSTIIAGLLT